MQIFFLLREQNLISWILIFKKEERRENKLYIKILFFVLAEYFLIINICKYLTNP